MRYQDRAASWSFICMSTHVTWMQLTYAEGQVNLRQAMIDKGNLALRQDTIHFMLSSVATTSFKRARQCVELRCHQHSLIAIEPAEYHGHGYQAMQPTV